MKVRAERLGSAVIIDLDGRLTVEADTRRLQELVRAVVQSDPSHVVLDLGRVPQLDCSGIGQLVQIYNRVRGSCAIFALVNVARRQRHLLELAGLLDVLQVFETWSEAVLWSTTPAGRVRQAPVAGSGAAAVA